MPKNPDLIIIYVKPLEKGAVKTRLAKSIGEEAALRVYEELLEITREVVSRLGADKEVHFASPPEVDHFWKAKLFKKDIQKGTDLGERMLNSFIKGFKQGYQKVILIGSDCPGINKSIILKGFEALNDYDIVLGPAEDGGYYLVGLTSPLDYLFFNKPWSKKSLLRETIKTIKQHQHTYRLLPQLRDIDDLSDLKTWKKNPSR